MSEINKTQEEFLANFNWHNYAEGIDAVDEKNLQEFEDLVTKTFISTGDEEVVEGVVVRITDRELPLTVVVWLDSSKITDSNKEQILSSTFSGKINVKVESRRA